MGDPYYAFPMKDLPPELADLPCWAQEIQLSHHPTEKKWIEDLRKWNEEECEALERMYEKSQNPKT